MECGLDRIVLLDHLARLVGFVNRSFECPVCHQVQGHEPTCFVEECKKLLNDIQDHRGIDVPGVDWL